MGSRVITVGLAVVVLGGTTAVSIAGSAGGPPSSAAVAEYGNGNHGHHGNGNGNGNNGNGGNNGNPHPPGPPPHRVTTPTTCTTLAADDRAAEQDAHARHQAVLDSLSGADRSKLTRVFKRDEKLLHARFERGEQSCAGGGRAAGGCSAIALENRMIEKAVRDRHRKVLKALSGDTRAKAKDAFKADQKALHDQQKAAVGACRGG